MFAVAEAEDLDVLEADAPAGWWDVTSRGVQDAVVGPAECAFLDGDVATDVDAVDLDVPVWESGQPAAEELGASRLSLAAHAAWCLEHDVVGEHLGEPVDVVGVEGFSSP